MKASSYTSIHYMYISMQCWAILPVTTVLCLRQVTGTGHALWTLNCCMELYTNTCTQHILGMGLKHLANYQWQLYLVIHCDQKTSMFCLSNSHIGFAFLFPRVKLPVQCVPRITKETYQFGIYTRIFEKTDPDNVLDSGYLYYCTV